MLPHTIALLVACQVITPLTPGPPVQKHAPNTTACSLRFWLPPSWRKVVLEGSVCTIGIQPAKSKYGPGRYPLEITVQKGDLAPLAEAKDFIQRDGRWYCYSNDVVDPALELSGKYRGLYCHMTYRAENADGTYAGVSEGTMAAFSSSSLSVHAVAREAPALAPFRDFLCSVQLPK